jgi:hypothetical protein
MNGCIHIVAVFTRSKPIGVIVSIAHRAVAIIVVGISAVGFGCAGVGVWVGVVAVKDSIAVSHVPVGRIARAHLYALVAVAIVVCISKPDGLGGRIDDVVFIIDEAVTVVVDPIADLRGAGMDVRIVVVAVDVRSEAVAVVVLRLCGVLG